MREALGLDPNSIPTNSDHDPRQASNTRPHIKDPEYCNGHLSNPPKGMRTADKERWYDEKLNRDPNILFHDIHLCANRGPNGAPTYDSAGYQLSYKLCQKWVRPTPIRRGGGGMKGMKLWEKQMNERREMADHFFEPGAAPESMCDAREDYWHDRVSKDLGVPFPQITLDHYKKWDKRGFEKAKKHQYEKLTDDESKRQLSLMKGNAIRKDTRSSI